MNRRPFSYRATWHELLRTSDAPLVRVVASQAMAALLVSLALAGAWIETVERRGATTMPPYTLTLRSTTLPSAGAAATTAPPAWVVAVPRMLRVSPDHSTVETTVVIAAAVWLAMLVFLWRPRRGATATPIHPDDLESHAGRLTIPFIGTAFLAAAALLGTWWIARSSYTPGDQRYLHATLWPAFAGLLLLLWLPALRTTLTRTRELFDLGGQINVRCPRCNYLLVGLKQLRCPECGMEFTIDELIRAQKFAQDQAADE